MRNDVIIRPVMTEKSMREAKEKKYCFLVHPKATKPMIATAVNNLFSVHVVHVHTMTRHGKTRRIGRRRLPIQTPTTKRAIVEIRKDQSISLFETQKGKGV
ncbi:MAG: 50S ribosomal protein L23 [bacterium]|nr:50S ribosomal protein L23 [bacterium]